MSKQKILVVGATGYLGGKVVQQALTKGKTVLALVRPGSDATKLEAAGVEIVRGDLTDRPSLIGALEGADALITTAIGYAKRRKTDSLAAVDDIGNRNLVDAARATGLPLFVFTSILTADKAVHVPHYYQKKMIEDYLEQQGVPFVALRPGGFLDSLLSAKAVQRGQIRGMISPSARASTILAEDVARYLVQSVDTPAVLGKRVALGAEPVVDLHEIARLLSDILGRKITVQNLPDFAVKSMMSVAGLFSPTMRDFKPMLAYVASGQYVADTTEQRQLFGDVPTIEDSLRRWATQEGLLVPQKTQAA
jgi:uncharacterized protein YbjT (DUF2867 family)